MAFIKPIEIKKSSGLGNLVKIGAGIASGGALGGLGAATGVPLMDISDIGGKIKDWFRPTSIAPSGDSAISRRLGGMPGQRMIGRGF
jgi:hypothetical protein